MPDLVPILVPVLLCCGLGWAWVRMGRAYDRTLLSALISDVGAPCLVFSELSTLTLDGGAIAVMVGGAFATAVVCGAIGAVVLRALGLPTHTFLAPIMFGNTGNLGLPLCLFAFGEHGLALGVAFFATTAFTHFTLGIWIWSGRASLDELARTPLSWAAVAAATVQGLDLSVPLWLMRTTELLGGFTIPLMLITLGVSLGELRLGRIPTTFLIAALRLGLGFALGVGLSALLGLTGAARGVMIIQCAMPAAVFNFLLAERYRRSPEEVASVVVLSTLLTLPALPFLLTWALR